MEASNFHKIGKYSDSELSSILKTIQIDCICILSIWGETFCYTLSEAVICGIPVLGIDIGAVGERIKEFGYGWTIPYPATAIDIVSKLDSIFSDEYLFNSVVQKTLNHHEKTAAEMAEEYSNMYSHLLINKNPSYNVHDTKLILSALQKNDHFVYRTDGLSWFSFEKYVELQKMQNCFENNEVNITKINETIQKNLKMINKICVIKTVIGRKMMNFLNILHLKFK